ncbi:hypothetical protein CEXT_439721 [Caerostris extrusa]|uniref:Transmembrane protein n=1 Tax=Caerostris extrusa TaxID=172846 RepID=A0AAV4SF10_CAEEX|nr:hypothetical protein CEXT_439721 [Caerostris extrusa]
MDTQHPIRNSACDVSPSLSVILAQCPSDGLHLFPEPVPSDHNKTGEKRGKPGANRKTGGRKTNVALVVTVATTCKDAKRCPRAKRQILSSPAPTPAHALRMLMGGTRKDQRLCLFGATPTQKNAFDILFYKRKEEEKKRRVLFFFFFSLLLFHIFFYIFISVFLSLSPLKRPCIVFGLCQHAALNCRLVGRLDFVFSGNVCTPGSDVSLECCYYYRTEGVTGESR